MILARNNVNVYGNGKRHMIFAHGFGCDQTMWRFVAPAFAENHRVVLFDYVGSGKSDTTAYNIDKYCTLSGYVQDLLDVCEELEVKDAIFVGHSVSCMIGLLASIREPDRFGKMIMIGPSPCYLNDPPDYFGGFEKADLLGLVELMNRNDGGWARFLAPLVMNNPNRPHLSTELEKSFCSSDPDITRRFAIATFFSDHRDVLPDVTVPSLILQCTDDAIAPLAVGNYLCSHLANSELVVMQAAGHCPHVSHPEETVRKIREYLAETDVRPLAKGVS